VKLTGLAPATLKKKYILAGEGQDVWWNVTDLGYLAPTGCGRRSVGMSREAVPNLNRISAVGSGPTALIARAVC
jgi:hypothetical protein